jgi:hypothetical protein
MQMADSTGRNAAATAPGGERPDHRANAEGFASEADYEAYLDAPIEGAAREELQRQIAEVRAEIENLSARLQIIRHRAGSVVTENLRWADASAHAQLGDYPWAKLAGAMAAAFLAGRALQRLPFGPLAGAAAPLVMAALRERRR